MIQASPPLVRLEDYRPPSFLIDQIVMDIDIRDSYVRVTSRIDLFRNKKLGGNNNAPLVLFGENQKLERVVLNNRMLSPREYKLTEHGLVIKSVPLKSSLEIVSTHNPYTNTTLSGLYASGRMLSTQCEPEGFRRITYYPDRPDVMAKFKVTIHAARDRYPILLANGNLLAQGDEEKGRHFATWHDPFPKPSYLFAMVAGKFDKVTDHFVTRSGRKVLLEIFVEPGRKSETKFALIALKKAMKWDEKTFGLEYDLDRFMMVATPFFNMGAMENKGLNIFNDACVLGRTDTTTDSTISFIERVVGHEYFHNWTGDRITCRDWFQLSLKEGLTVFREQEFMGDMNSVAVERLGNVRLLRRAQFAEDAGAMAHAVRPDRYKAIDNFYTATVYEKGAEVVRMLQSLLGNSGFKRGMQLYVKRHDGQAVTCDDFVAAMVDANRVSLGHFDRWYSQAGTPVLTVTMHYNPRAKSMTLAVHQKTPPTPGQKIKKPLVIPLAVGLLDKKGRDLFPTRLLRVTRAKEQFVFKNVKSKPVPSLLRNFSAPVRLVVPQQTADDLLFLLAHDSDEFNRWDAGYRLATKNILARILNPQEENHSAEKLSDAFRNVLMDPRLDDSFKAMVLSLPSEGELGLSLRAEGKTIDVRQLFQVRRLFQKQMALLLEAELESTYQRCRHVSATATDGLSMGSRSLKNICLAHLASLEKQTWLKIIFKQATTSKNMTDTVSALGILVDTNSPYKERALQLFEKRWRKVPTIMDKWFALQASARDPLAIKRVKKLMNHKVFDLKNPNRVSALVGSFAANGLGFHAADGEGYRFTATMIKKLDSVNPHAAAMLAKNFARWRDFIPALQSLMRHELKTLYGQKKLSSNVKEIVERSLKH